MNPEMQRRVELLWDALDDVMEQLNKPLPAKRSHEEALRGIDHSKMEREKMRGEALGLARGIGYMIGKSVEAVREEAVRRYVDRGAQDWGRSLGVS